MGIILVTRATEELGIRNKALANYVGIILVTRITYYSRAQSISLRVSF